MDEQHAARHAVVQGAGSPRPERSHFRSLEIWHTPEPDSPAGPIGWLGRLAEQLALRDPSALAAVHVGDEDRPLALWARSFRAPTVRDPEPATEMLTKALASWLADALRVLSASGLAPEAALKELTAARRHMFNAAGLYDALPWKPQW